MEDKKNIPKQQYADIEVNLPPCLIHEVVKHYPYKYGYFPKTDNMFNIIS